MELLLRDLLTSLTLWFFDESRRKNWSATPSRSGPPSIIRPPDGLQGFGWALLVWVPFAASLAFSAFHELLSDRAARWLPLVLASVAAPLGAYLLLHARRSFVYFNRRGVILKRPFRRLQHISWDQIRNLEYLPLLSRLALHASDRALEIPLGFVGFSALIDQARQVLPKELWGEPLARIEKDYLNGRT